jgi:hypothetical protein
MTTMGVIKSEVTSFNGTPSNEHSYITLQSSEILVYSSPEMLGLATNKKL